MTCWHLWTNTEYNNSLVSDVSNQWCNFLFLLLNPHCKKSEFSAEIWYLFSETLQKVVIYLLALFDGCFPFARGKCSVKCTNLHKLKLADHRQKARNCETCLLPSGQEIWHQFYVENALIFGDMISATAIQEVKLLLVFWNFVTLPFCNEVRFQA